MIAVVTVLVAFPAGLLLRSYLGATVAYVAAYSWAFGFQGVYLVRSWVGGDHSAFPADPDGAPIGYGVVTLAILLVGLGLVRAGHLVGERRRARRSQRDGVLAG